MVFRQVSIAGCLLLMHLGAPAVYSQAIDDVLGGFDDPAFSVETILDDVEENKSSKLQLAGWDIYGNVNAATAYNYNNHFSSTGTDYQGFSKLRFRLNLFADKSFNEHWQAKINPYIFYDTIYTLRSGNNYTDKVKEEYRQDIDIHDAYLLGKLNDEWDLKLGRQVAIWGYSDNLRVLDVLNPLDNLEPGLADIEDLRLPVTMIRMDGYFDTWQASIIVIPEMRFSKNPPEGSDFYISPGNNIRIDEEKPDHFDRPNIAIALKGVFSGWDISFHTARLWLDETYFDTSRVGFTNPALTPADIINNSQLSHSRSNMLGMGGQFTVESWLFKSEYAYFDSIDFTETSSLFIPPLGAITLPGENTEKSRSDILLGLEYFGFSNTTLSADLVFRHIHDYDKPLLNQESTRSQIAMRINRNFLNERLDINAIIILESNKQLSSSLGGISRLDASYEIRNNLTVSGGVLSYHNGKRLPYNYYSDNDRLFADIKWSFQ